MYKTILLVAVLASTANAQLPKSTVLYQPPAKPAALGEESYSDKMARLMRERDQKQAADKQRQEAKRDKRADDWKTRQSKVRPQKSR